jgi:hypothetical protein
MRVTWQLLILAALIVIMSASLALQRQANEELRGMITLLRGQNHEVERLQAERARLVKGQISPAERESLLADHAAIERLRGEIESAKARLIESEQAERSPPSHD